MNRELSGFLKFFVKNSFGFALLTPFNCLQKYLLFRTSLKHWPLNLNLVGNVLDTKTLSCVAEKRFGQMGVYFIFFILLSFRGASKHKIYLFQRQKKVYPHQIDIVHYLLLTFIY